MLLYVRVSLDKLSTDPEGWWEWMEMVFNRNLLVPGQEALWVLARLCLARVLNLDFRFSANTIQRRVDSNVSSLCPPFQQELIVLGTRMFPPESLTGQYLLCLTLFFLSPFFFLLFLPPSLPPLFLSLSLFLEPLPPLILNTDIHKATCLQSVWQLRFALSSQMTP